MIRHYVMREIISTPQQLSGSHQAHSFKFLAKVHLSFLYLPQPHTHVLQYNLGPICSFQELPHELLDIFFCQVLVIGCIAKSCKLPSWHIRNF